MRTETVAERTDDLAGIVDTIDKGLTGARVIDRRPGSRRSVEYKTMGQPIRIDVVADKHS